MTCKLIVLWILNRQAKIFLRVLFLLFTIKINSLAKLKHINLIILPVKNKYKETLFMFNKSLRKNYHEFIIYNLRSFRDLKVDGFQPNLCYVKTTLLLINFFSRQHSLMNRPCYNNSFHFMQHDKFRNWNRVLLIENMYSPELMSFDIVFQ